jgi:hypothetical protein
VTQLRRFCCRLLCGTVTPFGIHDVQCGRGVLHVWLFVSCLAPECFWTVSHCETHSLLNPMIDPEVHRPLHACWLQYATGPDALAATYSGLQCSSCTVMLSSVFGLQCACIYLSTVIAMSVPIACNICECAGACSPALTLPADLNTLPICVFLGHTGVGCTCTSEYAPVCAPTGYTYSNTCNAACFGFSTYTPGACGKSPSEYSHLVIGHIT